MPATTRQMNAFRLRMSEHCIVVHDCATRLTDGLDQHFTIPTDLDYICRQLEFLIDRCAKLTMEVQDFRGTYLDGQ